MCSKAPKAPKPTEQEKPAILLTARDGMGNFQAGSNAGRKSMRIDLNNSTTAYGSSLVIPT